MVMLIAAFTVTTSILELVILFFKGLLTMSVSNG